MERSLPALQPPNPDSTDKPLSFVNHAINLRNSDVEMTSVVQDPIPDERSFFRRSFHFLREKRCIRKLFMLIYAVFLLLQLIGLAIYVARATVCCVIFNLPSYKCNRTVIINHELQLELSWITAQVVTGFLCCCVVCKWHGAKGVKLILRNLKRLPKFWCLMGMIAASGAAMVYVTLVLYKTKTRTKITPLQIAILPIFYMHFLAMAVLVPLLNYTPIFAICKQKAYSRSLRLLVRLTLVLMFIVNFVVFFIEILQLGFKISVGIDSNTKGYFDWRIDNRALLIIRDLTDVLFLKIMQSFFWNKLFWDNKNILSHMESLEPLTDSD